MSDSKPSLILYGVPFSQPVRAVMWLLFMKRMPFELVMINPGSKGDNGSRNPAYLAKNPAGTIPSIEERDTGFVLGESHAILAYLATKHGWTDVYPADAQGKAKVDWYLHFHHRTIREASLGLVAPKIRKDLDIPELMQAVARANFTRGIEALDTGWLADSTFLCGDRPTIADLAAYVEIGQVQPQYTNVFDFSAYPNVQRWLAAMHEVPGHDDTHVVLAEIGDISQQAPPMDKIRDANIKALSVMKQRVAEFGGA